MFLECKDKSFIEIFFRVCKIEKLLKYHLMITDKVIKFRKS